MEPQFELPSRRDCVKAGVLAAAAASAGCAMTALKAGSAVVKGPPPRCVRKQDRRFLDRIAFGPSCFEIDRLASLGTAAYVEEQLRGDSDETWVLRLLIDRLEVFQIEPVDLYDWPREDVLRQLQQAAIVRAVYGRNQLRERMVDFWSNHFNIYANKGNTAFAKGVEENRVVRKHALGKFPELLLGIARSPAMLEFLDNQRNRKGVANENYARELLELHTMGLHGGYSQRDVQEVARCFTGWTIEDRFLRPRGQFRFDADLHDDGPKSVLGQELPSGGGEHDAEAVLNVVANHPSTSRFIAGKICRYFLGHEDPALVAHLSGIYRGTGGDIGEMVRPLLVSNELLESPLVVKRPFDFMVSALRVTESETDGGAAIQDHLRKMGEPLYEWPMPDGYPEKTSSWTSNLLPRWNFAFALASGGIPGTSVHLDPLIEGLGSSGVGEYIEPSSGSSQSQDLSTTVALRIASPEYQWR